MGMSMGGGNGQPILLSVADVLQKLQVCKAFFYKMIRNGDGPTLTKLGDRTFVSTENLESWLKTRELKR
jgi:predicted DNA-binding transcriptional regulator AlpA